MSLPAPFADVPPFWTGGPDPSGYYSFPNRPGNGSKTTSGTKSHSQYPITTGTSVFGIRYKDGIVLAADTLGSYGSLARYQVQRVVRVNETTVLATTGDIADFQYLYGIIERKQIDEEIHGGGVTMKPEALHCWLTRVLYNRRSKFDPLWNTIIVGGMQDGKPFMGCVDYIGTAWKENAVATGLGANLAIPIMNNELEKIGGAENLTLAEAKEILVKCLRVCYLRDCRATNTYHMSVINKDGATVEGPMKVDSSWEIATWVKGYE